MSNVHNFVIPHFYIIWKILKNPPVGRPIVAGYKWIFTPASIFVGHFLKEFYSKFDSILNDSLSLVKLLENNRFDKNCFLFTIDFKSLYTNIPVEDAINSIRKLCFDFQNIIPNAHFIIELLDLVLHSSLMVFDGEYFQQIFGLIMGTNVAPILTNIYMAMLENELKIKCCSDPKLIWPVLFKRFIDDGFGITKGLRKDVEYWIEQFNGLRKTVQIDKYNGETPWIIWIYLFTKVVNSMRMVNFRCLFIKKTPTNLCISHIDPSIKNTLSRTMFGESLCVMYDITRRKKTLKNSKHSFSYAFAIVGSKSIYFSSCLVKSHTHKGMNYLIKKN